MQHFFKNIKKIAAVSLCTVLIGGSAAAYTSISPESNISVSAADSLQWGDFRYSFNNDSTICIDRYTGDDEYIYIPDIIENNKVTVIGDNSFCDNTDIISVVIPNTVQKIGLYAFAGCSSLKSIAIPSSVTSIDNGAFGFRYEEEVFLNTVSGRIGSAAETFAKENNFTFWPTDTEVTEPVSIKLSKTSLTLEKGKTETITASVYPNYATNKTLVWSTSDKNIASVTDGEVKAISAGTAIITARTYNGITAKCKVSVKAPSIAVTQLKLNKTNISLGKGESYDLKATIIPSNATTKTVRWTSSDSNIVSISNGKITGKNNGTATIKAWTPNGVSALCKVTVKNAPAKVSMNKTTLSLGMGETFSLSSILPEGTAAATRTYSASSSRVVSMTKTDWTGEFVAVGTGTTTVTVRLYNGTEASCKVVVKPAPSKVTISKGTMTLGTGETGKLSCSIPSGTAAATRTFRTSNSKVIKMTKTNWTGEFTAVGTGIAWVTVRTYNGKESSCKITVIESGKGKKIYLSPSNQSGNLYSYGDTNEMEQCNRIADAAKTALERCGFEVRKAAKLQDMYVSIAEGNAWGADLYLPIHTKVRSTEYPESGTMCMVYNSTDENLKYAKAIYNAVQAITPGKHDYGVIDRPDLTELAKTKCIAVYTEVDFHDFPEIAKWLIDNTDQIGEAIAKGVCDAYNVKYVAPATAAR